MMCKLFVVRNYIADNNISLLWVAQAKALKLSLDLGGVFGFVAAMMGSNSNRISASN